jgi:phenylpropionate dioxygenase-like ring-hydroxylating dioxygenase large terminal subunit
MIRNQWYAVLESREIKPNQAIGVIRLGEKMAFWRDSNKQVHCVIDRCIHRGAALSPGKVVHDHLQCPFHGLEYDGTGIVKVIPANGRVAPVPEYFKIDSYLVQEAHDFIWIWWGNRPDEQSKKNLPPIPFFDDITENFSYSTIIDVWPVNYSRAIENQLDVVHLPFVHYNTIGRGQQTIVDGPIAELEEEESGRTLLSVWYTNRKEDGTIANKREELPPPTGAPLLQFYFPHIWQNRLGDKFRIFVAFVPIDENHTKFYLRTYQAIITIPILKHIVNWFAKLGNPVILNQDKRVVITQVPPRSDYQMDEKLIAGDYPIVLYRRKRQDLLNAEMGVKIKPTQKKSNVI